MHNLTLLDRDPVKQQVLQPHVGLHYFLKLHLNSICQIIIVGTGVSAPEALVLICTRNDLFCNNRIGWRRGCVSGMSGMCPWRKFTFEHSKSATQRDEIKLPLSNFRGTTVCPICQVFIMERCPKNEATAKNFVWNKTLPILKKSGKTFNGGRCHPHPHWRVKPMTCNRL